MERGEGLTTIVKVLTTEAGPVTVQHLIETTGMSKQSLFRWEEKLKRAGLIKITRRKRKLKTIELSDSGKEALPRLVHELQTNADHHAVPKKTLYVLRRDLKQMGRPEKAALEVNRRPEPGSKPCDDGTDYSWVLLAQGFYEESRFAAS
jgi:DNA-binding PadR family transcriptional regulator